MRYNLLLLTSMLLLAACSTVPSSPSFDKADKLTVPMVKNYTRTEQTAARGELLTYGPSIPMLSAMINDYGRMRDAARAAKGLKVDLTR